MSPRPWRIVEQLRGHPDTHCEHEYLLDADGKTLGVVDNLCKEARDLLLAPNDDVEAPKRDYDRGYSDAILDVEIAVRQLNER